MSIVQLSEEMCGPKQNNNLKDCWLFLSLRHSVKLSKYFQT